MMDVVGLRFRFILSKLRLAKFGGMCELEVPA